MIVISYIIVHFVLFDRLYLLHTLLAVVFLILAN